MDKRGVSNIEFIMAFILFIGFVVTAIYFFNPISSTGVLESSATYAINEIIKNTTVEVESYSVKLSGGPDIIYVEIDGLDNNKKARVESYDGKKLPSRREGDRIHFDRNREDFIVISFSEDFDAGDFGETGASGDYQIASFRSSEEISEKRVSKLKELYEQDYSLLKEQRDLPPGIDFSFSLEFPNGESIKAEMNAPQRAQVFSETRIKEVLKKDGASEFAYLTVRIW